MARNAGEVKANGFTPSSRGPGLAFLVAMVVMVGAGVTFLSPGAAAKNKFMSGFAEAYPHAAGTPLDSCVLCHTDPAHPGEDNLNNYGEDWEDVGDKDYLAPALVDRDSDGDGISNGQEIQQLSLPGDPSSSTPPPPTTTVPGAPLDGRSLYGARCAVCHGPEGGDLNGTALAREAFISITLNGQGGMPSQTGLSSQEVGAIWDYVSGVVPATTTTTQPGITTTTTQPAGGAAVWAQHCAVCHGAAGGNVVPTTASRTQLVSTITNGVGTMRGFPELGSAQIGNVADFLLSLSTPTTTLPGATTTTTAPRRGAAVYAADCAVCHGADGGDLRGHALTQSQIVSITTNGIGTMSGFAGRLSVVEIDNVSQFVASVGIGAGVTTTTSPSGSPISGSTLYMQNCSACHGLHGEGGPGGPVAGTTSSRSQIISVTTGGAGGMPGYGSRLSADEIGAIADHILGMGGSGTTENATVASEPGIPPELLEGQTLYGQFCAACHGAAGEGGSGGPIVSIQTSTGDLDEIIRNGVGSMPGFAGQLGDRELEALVAFSEALASGAELIIPETTTSTLTEDETPAAGDLPAALAGDLNQDPAADGSSTVVVVAVVVGVLVTGGGVFLWMRAVRNLVA